MSDFKAEYKDAMTVEWDDPDHEGDPDEWPYPTRYIRRVIDGPLAVAIRRRLDAPVDAVVTITEEEISGGYSEFTQETDYSMLIECAGFSQRFDYAWSQESNLVKMLEWLDGHD